MIGLDHYVPEKKKKSMFDFRAVRGGMSIWCETHNERVSTVADFKKWAKATASSITVRSTKVDASDPKGEGFRVIFEEHKKPIKQSLLAHLIDMDEFRDKEQLRYMALRNGIASADDIMAALNSLDYVPTTIGEMKKINGMIRGGLTPYQRKWREDRGIMSPEEQRAYSEAKAAAFTLAPRTYAWHDDGRQIGIGWNDLTDKQRSTAIENGVTTETEYLRQMRSMDPRWDEQIAVGHVITGHGGARSYAASAMHNRPSWWNDVYGEDDPGVLGDGGEGEL